MSARPPKVKSSSPKSDDAATGSRKQMIRIAAGAAIGSAAIAGALLFAGRLSNRFVDAPENAGRARTRGRKAEKTPAAFKVPAGPDGAIVSVRDAGPDNIRDLEPGRSWDRADEASDASFPASDPPGTY